MAAEGPGPSDMADRGESTVDPRRPIAIIRDEINIYEDEPSRSDFEPLIEWMLGLEQCIPTGLYRVTVLVEPLVNEEEAYVAFATPQRVPPNRRRPDRSEDPRDAGI